MALSQSNVIKTKYVEEVTPGINPGTALTILPVKSSNINGNKTTVTSAEIRSDRATADLIISTGSTSGDIAFELSFTDYKVFIESALGSSTVTPKTYTTPVAGTIVFTTGAGTAPDTAVLTAAGAAITTTDFPVGSWVKLSGFAAAGANGIGKVVSIGGAGTILTLTAVSITASSAVSTAVTIKGQFIKNGATKKTFTLEKEYPDLSPAVFSSHKGMQVNTMSINTSSGQIIEGTMAFMGRDSAWSAVTVGTGTNNDIIPAATPILSATANVGTIYVDGVALTGTYLKSINLSTNNNARQLDAVGNAYPVDVNLGTFDAKIAVEAFFNSTALIEKFLAGTAVALAYSFTDSNGNVIVIDAPRCKLDSGTVSAATLNADTTQSLSFTALLGADNFMLGINMLAA